MHCRALIKRCLSWDGDALAGEAYEHFERVVGIRLYIESTKAVMSLMFVSCAHCCRQMYCAVREL